MGAKDMELAPDISAVSAYHPLWDMVNINVLTDQEWRSLYLLSEGYTAREASRILGIKPSTLRTHKEKAIRKLREQTRQFVLYS